MADEPRAEIIPDGTRIRLNGVSIDGTGLAPSADAGARLGAPGAPSYGSEYAELLAPPKAAPPAPPRRASTSWAAAPATYVLLGINCAVFLGMVLTGVSAIAPQPEQLLHWGADYGAYVLVLGQWWRLVTAMFVHVGFLHLATNMWCLWNLGLLGEPLLGAPGLIAAYLLTGFAGNLLSIATHPGVRDGGAGGAVGAGASGAIFGLAGVLIVLLSSKYLPLPMPERKALRRSVIWFAVLNFVLAAGIDVSHFSLRIDNSAHLGGFLAGLLLALPMVPRIGAPGDLFRRRRNLAVVGEALLLLLLCAGLRAFYAGDTQVTAYKAEPTTVAGTTQTLARAGYQHPLGSRCPWRSARSPDEPRTAESGRKAS